MRNSILVPILLAVVLTGGATFFITKSVCSNNSESQVVAYLRAKEAEAEKAAYPKGREAARKAEAALKKALRD